jgi:hypothetical protein
MQTRAQTKGETVNTRRSSFFPKRGETSGFFQPTPVPVNMIDAGASIQRKCAACEQEELQRKEAQGERGSQEASSLVDHVVSSPGDAMDAGTRTFMENRFGYDFSDVKIHTNDVAAKSASAINALAYTNGNNIAFNKGQYDPGSEKGNRLLAHELTHVIQQGGDAGRISRQEEEEQDTNFTSDPDPCTYSGTANREREVHLNLALHSVRVYTGRTTFTQFDNLITGPSTRSLARANDWCHMYRVQGHQSVSGNGLLNFVNYCGEFGFHSNFWRKRRGGRTVIERIPGAESHGCARLHDADSTSTSTGDSRAFYDMVQDGDCVRIYSRSDWRPPTFKPCRDDADCTP